MGHRRIISFQQTRPLNEINHIFLGPAKTSQGLFGVTSQNQGTIDCTALTATQKIFEITPQPSTYLNSKRGSFENNTFRVKRKDGKTDSERITLGRKLGDGETEKELFELHQSHAEQLIMSGIRVHPRWEQQSPRQLLEPSPLREFLRTRMSCTCVQGVVTPKQGEVQRHARPEKGGLRKPRQVSHNLSGDFESSF